METGWWFIDDIAKQGQVKLCCTLFVTLESSVEGGEIWRPSQVSHLEEENQDGMVPWLAAN